MAVDPVCGMTVDPARAAGSVAHEGTTYYFCSKGCAAKFTADPKKYLSGVREPMRPMAAPVLSIGGVTRAQHPAPTTQPATSTQQPAIDPVCGMTVDPARAAGTVEHNGKTYYFCSKGCVAKFAADHDKYLSHQAPAPASHQAPESAPHPAPAPSTQHPAPRSGPAPWIRR